MLKQYFLIVFIILLAGVNQISAIEFSPWVVYYSDQASIDAFAPYQLIILDPDQHPPLKPLFAQGKSLLAYISLGEVNRNRSYFHSVKNQNILLKENETWSGSFYVDVRSDLWAVRVIKRLIPAVLSQGFDGLFIDTLDNPIELERLDPVRFKGMMHAAEILVKRIRVHYPNILIMVNRGYPLLTEVAPFIDMVLGESVYSDFNFVKKIYQRVNTPLYQSQVVTLKNLKKQHPRLGIFTLDYWHENDPKGLKQIYEIQRKNGFIPYVSTIQLDKIIEEPK